MTAKLLTAAEVALAETRDVLAFENVRRRARLALESERGPGAAYADGTQPLDPVEALLEAAPHAGVVVRHEGGRDPARVGEGLGQGDDVAGDLVAVAAVAVARGLERREQRADGRARPVAGGQHALEDDALWEHLEKACKT